MENFLSNYSEKDITYSLYGLFLGDGHYRSGRICINHTNKQRFYVKWLESIFRHYGLYVHSRYDFKIKTTFGIIEYSSIDIKVPKRFYFETENRCIDGNGKKIVSDYVMENINPFGLLLWFLDDGNWHVSFKNNKAKRFGYLNTQSFTYNENLKILNMFKHRFDIDLKIHKDSSGFEKFKESVYYRLYFNAKNFQKFFDILRPFLQYIPNDFYYKFNMQYYPGRGRDTIDLAEKYNLIAS